MSELKEPFEKEEFLHTLPERVVITYPLEQTQMVFSRNFFAGYDVQLCLYNGSDLIFLSEDKHYQSLDEVYELYLTTFRMQQRSSLPDLK